MNRDYTFTVTITLRESDSTPARHAKISEALVTEINEVLLHAVDVGRPDSDELHYLNTIGAESVEVANNPKDYSIELDQKS